MSLSRFLLRRRLTTTTTTATISQHHAPSTTTTTAKISGLHQTPTTTTTTATISQLYQTPTTTRFIPNRRMEPPLNALQRNPNAPRPRRDPNQPDTTSALVGPRISLHNRVESLIRAHDLDNAARQSVFSSKRPTVFTCNAIIGSMYRAKRFSDAIALFMYFFKHSNIVPNVVSYNFLIVSYCENGEVDKGLEVYQHIKENAPFSPSAVTFRHLTKGLVDAGRIDEAVALLWKMVGDGHGADSLVFNNVILGFLNLDNLEKANEFFDELKRRCVVYDGVVNATFMEWFFSKGRVKEAMENYRSLLDKEFKMVPATCNVLLEVLLKWGRKAEAQALFESMLDRHTPPVIQAVNSDTFNLMVNEYFKEGRATEAYGVFKKAGTAAKSKPFAMDTVGFNNMIDRYCELDMVDDAEKMYVELCGKSLSPDVNTYRTLIDAYFKLGRVDEAMEKYTKMVDAGLRVIPDYANKWFSELIENGKIVECEPILTKMAERDPKPDATTYDIVIRALCGVDNYDTSLNLLEQMIRYGVGVGPILKEYVLEVFKKVGRKEEVDQILNARWAGYASNMSSNGIAQQQHNGGDPNGYRQQTDSAPHGNVNGYEQRQHYGQGQQNNTRNDYVSIQQYNVRNTQQHNTTGSYNTDGQQPNMGVYHKNGQQYNLESYNANGQQYNTGSYNANGHWYDTRSYNANGQQYNTGSYNANAQQPMGGYNGKGQQYNTGTYNANGQRYNSGSYSANGLQYNSGSYNANALQYNTGSYYANGQQSYSGNGQQYNAVSYNGNGQRNNGNWNGNGNAQQYNNGSYNGNLQQYNNGGYNGNGERQENWQPNGSEEQVNREEGRELPEAGSVAVSYRELDMVDDAEKMYVEFCGKSLSPDVNTYKTLIDAYFKMGRVDEAMDKFAKMVDAGMRVIPDYANKWFSELIENGKIVECELILTKMAERDLKPDATTYEIVIRALCGVDNYDTSLKLLQQMIRYGVSVDPIIKEYVLEVFENVWPLEMMVAAGGDDSGGGSGGSSGWWLLLKEDWKGKEGKRN